MLAAMLPSHANNGIAEVVWARHDLDAE
jgi:hypothetical protein